MWNYNGNSRNDSHNGNNNTKIVINDNRNSNNDSNSNSDSKSNSNNNDDTAPCASSISYRDVRTFHTRVQFELRLYHNKRTGELGKQSSAPCTKRM